MAELAALRRHEYAQVHPQFWREAVSARDAQGRWFEELVDDEFTLTLVAEQQGELVGLLIASLVGAPPVYDPGGRTGFIDDFVVSAPLQWDTVGRELLVHARTWLRQRGAVQVVVVAGFHDEAKRALLDSEGLRVASTWHVASLASDVGDDL